MTTRPPARRRMTLPTAHPLIELWIPGRPIAARAMYGAPQIRQDGRHAPRRVHRSGDAIDVRALSDDALTWRRSVIRRILTWRWFRLYQTAAVPRLLSDARRPLRLHLAFRLPADVSTASARASEYLPLALDAVRYGLSATDAELGVVTSTIEVASMTTAPGSAARADHGLTLQVWQAEPANTASDADTAPETLAEIVPLAHSAIQAH